MSIDAYGDFTTFHGGRPRGMPSPIEQNMRHLKIMQRLLDAGVVRLPTRLGFTIRPVLRSLVLISPKARLTRPKAAVTGLDSVIKADQLDATIKRSLDAVGVFQLAKLVGPATLDDVARKVAALHRPHSFDWARRFPVRRTSAQVAPPVAPPVAAPPSNVIALSAARPPAPPICAACAVVVPQRVIDYCRANAARFDDALLCRDCQPAPGGARAIPRAS